MKSGPAFPIPVSDPASWNWDSNGMTMRQYYAAMAMQGYVMGWPNSGDVVEHLPTIAKMAFKMADAMLKEEA